MLTTRSEFRHPSKAQKKQVITIALTLFRTEKAGKSLATPLQAKLMSRIGTLYSAYLARTHAKNGKVLRFQRC